MKLKLESDVHMEFGRFFMIENVADVDVIVLAGDIYNRDKGVRWAIEEGEHFKKHVIYVAGNHEYYGHEYHENLAAMRKKAEESEWVHFLERDEVIIDGVRFLGATLWTDYMSNGREPENQHFNMANAELVLSDHRHIKYGDELFKPKHALALHKETVGWLTQKMDEPFDGKTVVVTYHGPSLECSHTDFGNNSVGSCFISDLDHLVKKADVWCYGHTHSNLDTYVGKCHLVSNQKGYPREVTPGVHGYRNNWVINTDDSIGRIIEENRDVLEMIGDDNEYWKSRDQDK